MASESSEDFSVDIGTTDSKTEDSIPQGSFVKNINNTSSASASNQEQEINEDTKKDDDKVILEDDESSISSWKTAELMEDTTESEKASEADKCKRDEEEKDSTKVEKTKGPKNKISLRLERLARPKKDILDKISHIRPYGSLPESSLPAWCDIPLQTKVPAGDCPFKMTKAQLATSLFLPPARFDLFDENNMRLPSKTYNSLEDPQLKTYFSQRRIRKHLHKKGFLSKTDRIICSLDDLNNYREYHRHMLAQQVQQYLREQDAEEKKEAQRKRKEQLDREDKVHIAKKTQGLLRKWIKDTVAFYEHRSLGRQTVREKKILNRQLRIQREIKEKIQAKQERYENIYNQHITTKYQAESIKRKLELEVAKKDMEVLEKLCRRKEGEKLEIKKKVIDFWERKSASQHDWLMKGKEVEEMMEKEKEYNLKVLRETGKFPRSIGKSGGKDTKVRNNLNAHENEEACISTDVSSIRDQNNGAGYNRKEETKAAVDKTETKSSEDQNPIKITNLASDENEQRRTPNLQLHTPNDGKEASASVHKDKETNEKKLENDAKNLKPSKTERSDSSVGTVVTVHRDSFLIDSGAVEVDVEVTKDTMTGVKDVVIDTRAVESFEMNSTETERSETASQNESI